MSAQCFEGGRASAKFTRLTRPFTRLSQPSSQPPRESVVFQSPHSPVLRVVSAGEWSWLARVTNSSFAQTGYLPSCVGGCESLVNGLVSLVKLANTSRASFQPHDIAKSQMLLAMSLPQRRQSRSNAFPADACLFPLDLYVVVTTTAVRIIAG